tara:strand:- start:52 stop:1053 length:1002 start_codon:yes stop_codon:yes gene_type:complete
LKENAESIFNDLLNDKKLATKRGDDESFAYGRIPFNIPQLDKITNGGIPRKRFTLLFGGWSSGKSYIASQLCKSVQEDGGVPMWIDLEKSWDPAWMEKVGVDITKILVADPATAEESFKVAQKGLRSGVDLIVLDSAAGIIPADIFNNDKGIDYSPIAWQSRTWNQMLIRLLPDLTYGSSLVAINQTRGAMGPVTAMETMPGGEGQKFFSHCCMQVSKGGWINEPSSSTNRVGFEIKVKLLKDKFGGEKWEEVVVPFRVEGGVDIVETYVRLGLEYGLIKQTGAWYTYEKMPSKVAGINKVVDWFKENPEEYEVFKDETEKFYTTGESDSKSS